MELATTPQRTIRDEKSTNAPKRIQLRRTKGWRKPEGVVVVSRPSKWGNPWKQSDFAGTWMRGDWRDLAVAFFRSAMDERTWCESNGIDVAEVPGFYPQMDEIRRELRGKDLACWCPLDQPCHADVLLEIANGAEQ